MKVRLIEYTGTKIEAIKCVRDAVPSLSLQMAKNLCETLPREIEVRSEYVDNLRRCFKVGVSDGTDTAVLFAAWDSLPRDRQAQLLQYLVGMGILSAPREANK